MTVKLLMVKKLKGDVMRRIFYSTCLYLVTLTGLSLTLSTSVVAAEASPVSAAEKTLSNIHLTTSVKEGKSTHVVYIFFDPNCPYCHRLYVNTRDWVKRNAMEFHWIPVGVLTTTSQGKAAAILGAKDPQKAFYQNEDHYMRNDDGGGIDEIIATDNIAKILKANVNVLQLSGSNAVPAMLFRANNGQAVMIQGAPPKKRLKQILQYVK